MSYMYKHRNENQEDPMYSNFMSDIEFQYASQLMGTLFASSVGSHQIILPVSLQ